MNYGRLIQRMEIETPVTTRTRGKVSAVEWQSMGFTYAAVEQLSGRKLEYARQVVPDATHEIRIRYDERIAANQRLTMNDRRFYIAAPPNNVNERNREMILICVERQDAEQADGE